MIIKVFGEYWSRDRVDWSSRRLIGKRKGKKPFDGWDQRGIYALYKDFKMIYVGLADSRGIGIRLAEHLTDRFGERWDSFSFFGICGLDDHGKARPASEITVGPSSVLKSLELLAILLSDPPLNRARGKFPDGAEKVWQVNPSRPTKSYQLDASLSSLVVEIKRLRSALSAKNRRPSVDEDL